MIIKIHCLSLITAITFWLSMSASHAQNTAVFNILDFGARQGDNFNSQKAIQDAIDQCDENGGGTVLIPAGTYYTTTIYLKSNMDLKFSNGASLVAIADKSLYNNAKPGLQESGDNFIAALLVAHHIDNFSISGNGVIKGQPAFYYTTVKDKDTYPGWNENAMKSGVSMERPWVKDPKISLVYISDCKHVLLDGISIVNSPNWSCHIQWSQNVRVNGITITSSLTEGVNSDGLDIDGCKSVMISNSIIKTGDDAICLKTTQQGARSESCEDILIDDCILSSSSCALKIGTESHSDFKRISFTNCMISNSNRGIGIIIRDGGTVSDVNFSNIGMDCKRKPFFWWGNGEAFQLNVLKRDGNSKPGKIENVVLNNIYGTVEGTSAIKGLSDSAGGRNSINQISLQNIALTLRAESEKDKRTGNAIELINASGIVLTDIHVNWQSLGKEPLWRNALFAENVDHLTMEEFTSNQEMLKNGCSEISLWDVKNVFVQTGRLGKNSLELKGNSENITVHRLNVEPDIVNKLDNEKQLKLK